MFMTKDEMRNRVKMTVRGVYYVEAMPTYSSGAWESDGEKYRFVIRCETSEGALFVRRHFDYSSRKEAVCAAKTAAKMLGIDVTGHELEQGV